MSRMHVALGAMAFLAFAPAAAQSFATNSDSSGPTAASNALPDAPSVVMQTLWDDQQDNMHTTPALPPPCPALAPESPGKAGPGVESSSTAPAPCVNENPLRIVVNFETRQPLTMGQKGYLAFHDVIGPFNLAVIGLEAGIGVAANSHSAYGPGLKGFGRLTGYQLLQDAQGEFLGVFLIPSLVHEDPRYRRMQNASVKRRIFHALARTVVAEHDDGRPMLNYATLLAYPISAELSNLYVPGVHGNAPDTAKRVAIGFALDPAGNLIAEFLPDLARRIHVRSVFVQQIVNSMALNPTVAGGTVP